MDKKERERTVLDETLAIARRRGGESRRNADRIIGEVEQGESPDFIIEPNKSRKSASTVVAVEHFRVDHFSELNIRGGHQDSLAVIERNRAEKIQHMWNPSSFDSSDIPQNVLDAVSGSFAKCLEARLKACYSGYIKSFSDGFNSHVHKIEAYQGNVNERFGNARKVKIALLIELHSDFSDCFVHEGGRCYKPEAGKLLLFDDMVNLIKSQRNNLDYILVGSYEALRDAVFDAAIIRPAQLSESLLRNKLSVFRYIGENRDEPIVRSTHIKPSATSADNLVNFNLEGESQRMPLAEQVQACFQSLPLAIAALHNKESFVTTLALQMLLELFGDTLEGKRRVSWVDIENARSLLGREEIDRRARQFEEKWYPDHKH